MRSRIIHAGQRTRLGWALGLWVAALLLSPVFVPAAQLATPIPSETATPQPIVDVVASTPNPDGSIIHEVQYGQALYNIVEAYGLTLAQLLERNGLPDNAVLYPGDKLVIQPSYTPTIAPTVTMTLVPPTRTPTLTATLRQPTRTRTPTVEPTATERALLPDPPELSPGFRRGLGIGMIVVCSIGLAAWVVSLIRSRK